MARSLLQMAHFILQMLHSLFTRGNRRPASPELSDFEIRGSSFLGYPSIGIFKSPSVWRIQARDFSIMGPAWPSHSMLRTPLQPGCGAS